MKYLKVFKNTSDYQEFIGGGDYITPNICLLEDNYNIVFEPEKKDEPLKQFSIEITDVLNSYEPKYFNFKEGMTWGEWINSEYCVDWYFYTNNIRVLVKISIDGKEYSITDTYPVTPVNVNDKILEVNYFTYHSGGSD